MRFPRFGFADPAPTDFEARCFGRVDRSSLLSWPGNGQRVVETAQGTLIGALPNYHVDSEFDFSTLEEFASPARINTTPRSLLNRRHYEAPSRCSISIQTYVCVYTHTQTVSFLGVYRVCRNEIRAFEIELDIHRFGKCGRCSMLSESQIEVLPRISRSFVLGGARLSLRRLGGMHARHVGL